jgi:hypothetical protein
VRGRKDLIGSRIMWRYARDKLALETLEDGEAFARRPKFTTPDA